ncbi:TPA: ABC transporter ATP-binding protein, partial [Candidatus Galligastranaerophilus intestinigallinarum]|nr:ABC transporter ATP-binding protein [Candidatus Galligastranaerophilus intestinigallinarum]
LILDEATSSLDVETENFVSENVANLKGEKTIIAIAHRLSTLKKCDRIIYLEEGKIKDEGTFDKLKEKHKEIENILKLSSF